MLSALRCYECGKRATFYLPHVDDAGMGRDLVCDACAGRAGAAVVALDGGGISWLADAVGERLVFAHLFGVCGARHVYRQHRSAHLIRMACGTRLVLAFTADRAGMLARLRAQVGLGKVRAALANAGAP